MDLRMVKTKYQIKKAFMLLREKMMPEKIKVKDICEIAMINKTTFYHHYTDSAELSEEIDNSAIDEVISKFPEKNKIFDDPKAFITGLFRALEQEAETLQTVFRGKQEVMCSKLEERLSSFYDGMIKNAEDGIKLSFAIGGFVRVVKDCIFTKKAYNIDSLTEITSEMIESLSKQQSKNLNIENQ